MAQIWLSVLVVLWMHLNAQIKVAEASLCAEVNTSASVVPVGSSISASCLIHSDCQLSKGKDFRVEWKINNQLVPSNLSYLESNQTYAVFIPNITDTRADITCSICGVDNCQIVDGRTVKVAYPPPVPKNLSCALNLSRPIRMLCQWDPGQPMANIPTNYTLHTKLCTGDRFQYVPPPGEHFYWIPPLGISLFFEMEIFVEVMNAFWNITSAPLLLVPMKTAKLGPPVIRSIEAYKFECLEYRWSLIESQVWIKTALNVELSLKTVDDQLAKELVFPSRVSQLETIKVCSLLYGTNYSAKMRVAYHNLWSEWSDSIVATTLIKAPTGRLDTWLKVPEDEDELAQLYWKPSQQFRANGVILLYTVKSIGKILCLTREDHCSFQLHKRFRKVYLTASNAKGNSTTEVTVYRKKGLDPVSNISVNPQSETSVLIGWESPVSSRVTGYVLEWRSLNKTSAAKRCPVDLSFALMNKNNCSTVVTGFEPFKPYEISVYPKYVDGIGRPLTVIAYSSQKAPSVAPDLQFGEIHSSNIELFWNEIPLEQRNGVIQGYTIFVWDDRHNIEIVKTRKTKVLVRRFQPLSTYNALVSVHTMGGSLNGSVISLKTDQIDRIDIVIFVIPACIALSLLIIISVFACPSKRLKMRLWPIIPDPANSSIRRWTTPDSLQGMPPFKEDKDPVLVYLSHCSLLNLSEKELCNSDYVKDNLWSHDNGSHDEGHNSFQTSSSCHSQQDTDSVPYATVVFGGPYQNQMSSPPVYLRSESTQPLLGVEDPGSPPPYENMLLEGVPKVNYFTTFSQNSTENEALWNDFPMLRSLQTRNTEHI